MSETLLEGLQRSADDEGRSLSNLCAHLLESGLERRQAAGCRLGQHCCIGA